jgi:hypothetical protein
VISYTIEFETRRGWNFQPGTITSDETVARAKLAELVRLDREATPAISRAWRVRSSTAQIVTKAHS